jgi:hypothetical protein
MGCRLLSLPVVSMVHLLVADGFGVRKEHAPEHLPAASSIRTGFCGPNSPGL